MNHDFALPILSHQHFEQAMNEAQSETDYEYYQQSFLGIFATTV